MSERRIHVAAGVLVDGASRVLVQRRDPNANQGDLWEFPGGKLQGDESALAALVRELREELGIEVLETDPLTLVEHHYPDLTVILEVWMVVRYGGRPEALEHQPLMWVDLETLPRLAMPEADRPVVRAILERHGRSSVIELSSQPWDPGR